MARRATDGRPVEEGIGQRLKALGVERGMRQVEMARRLGTYQTVVSAIERGARGLTLQQVVKLGAPPAELLTPRSAPAETPRQDGRFARRLERIAQLPKRDQQALLCTIDAFFTKVS